MRSSSTKKDRNLREKLFEFGRCVAHFAVDEAEVRFCTHLKGKASWFLPFNRGWNDGAGNPPGAVSAGSTAGSTWGCTGQPRQGFGPAARRLPGDSAKATR